MSKSLIRGSAALAVADFSKKALLAVTVLLCARLVPKSTFGNYMFLMSFYQIFSVVAGAGIPNILIREVASDLAWRPERLAGSVLARGVYAVPAVLLMFAFFFIGRYPLGMAPSLGALALLVLFRAATENAMSVFQGRQDALACAQISVVQSAVTFGTTLAVCLTGKALFALVACHLIGAVCSTIFAAFLFVHKRLSPLAGLTDSIAEARTLLRSTHWMNGAALVSTAYNRCDVLLLERLASADAVATYSAPYRILDLALILPSSVMGLVLARISRKERVALERVDQNRILSILILAALALIVVGTLLAPAAIPLLLGPAYLGSIHVVEALVWATPIMFCNYAINTNMLAQRNERFILFGCLGALAFNLAANALLIPHFGYMAAAFNTVGTECVLLLANVYFCRVAGISLHPLYPARLLLASAVGAAGSVLWALHDPPQHAIGGIFLMSAAGLGIMQLRQILI